MAGYSINRIPETQRVFLDGIPSLWRAPSASEFIVDFQTSKYLGQGSIKVTLPVYGSLIFNTATNGNNAESSSVSFFKSDIEDSATIFAWVKASRPVSLRLKASILFPPGVIAVGPYASASTSVNISSGEWTLIKLSNELFLQDDEYDYPVGFNFVVDATENNLPVTLHISSPCFYATLDFINNPAILDIASNLPEFIRQLDTEQDKPYQLLRFLEAATIHTGELLSLIEGFIYSDISEGKDQNDLTTLSTLVDVLAVDRQYMFWLSQFTGTQLVNPTTGFTPWENLPKNLDGKTTWQELDLIDEIESADDAAPWQAIQDFNTEPEGIVNFLRWQISTSYYGINAGTRESIIESVKRVLTGTKTVNYQVLQPFNWTIKITTLKSETPDSSLIDIGEPVPEILELIEPTKPAGFLVLHELI